MYEDKVTRMYVYILNIYVFIILTKGNKKMIHSV